MARKITAYNRFFAKHRRAGKSPKQIGAMWRKQKKGGSSSRRSSRARAAPRKRKRSMGSRIGGFSPLGIAKAAALYVGTSLAINRVAPQVSRSIPGATEMVAGAVATSTGLPGNAFLALGAAKALASAFGRVLNGGMTNGGGGYDY